MGRERLWTRVLHELGKLAGDFADQGAFAVIPRSKEIALWAKKW
jgi:hypothetical protein